MSDDDYTLDALCHAEPHKAHPCAGIGDPPCTHCEHARLCETELLACCAFAAYCNGVSGERSAHRVPTADWYAHVEHDAKEPPCNMCKPDIAVRVKKKYNGSKLKIMTALRNAPGSSTTQIAAAIGMSRVSTKSALARMRARKEAEVIGYTNDGLGHKTPLWRLV